MTDTETEVKHSGAVYECRCGNQSEFYPMEIPHLRWLRRRIGATNIGEAVAFLTDCCDRPEYVSTGGTDDD